MAARVHFSNVYDRLDPPVVHVSSNDALAFSQCSQRRLPTEEKWEYGARGGFEQKLFPWGDELTPRGRHLCNVWQGNFPGQNTAEDGYAGTCPVTAFPANQLGLYSMVGNTWEWCTDRFSTTRDATARLETYR
jgi:sulfatase modifying factor 1